MFSLYSVDDFDIVIYLSRVYFRYMSSIAEIRKKLTNLTQKLRNIHEQITQQLDLCYKYVGEHILHAVILE